MVSESDASDWTGQPPDRRMLIAVVHADVVGYSRLIGLDDSGTLDRMRRLRREVIEPALETHGGRIVNTGGDSLLMVFDSVDGAARFAVAVQQQVPSHDGAPPDRAIRFRIGINVGDVIPDGTDVHGDVVNVAARLQAECPPGGICVSRAVRDHMRGRLDLAFEALGALNLKNIAEPVEAFVLRSGSTPILPSVERQILQGTGEALPLPDKPSIAVLAFTNMSGDPEQEYFSDGIADDIITELSRSRSLFVISRNSSFTYKGRCDRRETGRRASLAFAMCWKAACVAAVSVSGSTRSSSMRRPATTSGRTATIVTLADVFAVQDEITLAVARAIGPAVDDAEQRRALRKPPESLGAWETYLRGQWHFGQRTVADHERAKQLFQRAAEIDAKFSAPYVGLARAYLDDAATFGTRSLEDAAELSAVWARKAIAIDPEDADAQAILANAALASGNFDEARDQVALARASNPNSPLAILIEAAGSPAHRRARAGATRPHGVPPCRPARARQLWGDARVRDVVLFRT